MITYSDIERIAKNRLIDSELLYRSMRYDGSYYLCGYVIELGLKYRICKTLGWIGYPSTSTEFQGYTSFKTHNLDILLRLSGIEIIVKSKVFTDWGIVRLWNSEIRYQPIGSIRPIDSKEMLKSSKTVLGELL